MISTFNATTTNLTDGFQVEAESRGIKLMIDEPVEAGGTDKGMNPVEVFLSALGGCQSIMAKMLAESVGVDLQGFRSELEGDMDLSGENPYNGYQEIRFTFYIKADTTQEKAEALADAVEASCPLGNTLKQSVKLVRKAVVLEK